MAELEDGVVWFGLVVSGSEAAGIHLQPITPCYERWILKVAFLVA